jgi:hypothetical protein
MPDDTHTIDSDAARVAAHLPMHLPGDLAERCPLCAFLRILAIAREAEGWKFAAEHTPGIGGDGPMERDAEEVDEMLRFAAHGEKGGE